MQYLSSVNLNQNELQNARIQNLATAPATPVKGQIYYNTTGNALYIWDGTLWDRLDNQTATVSIGTGLTNTGTAMDPIVAMPNVGTAGAQLPKVTTDAQGRVLSSAALVAADIPVLDWTKITTGKPTTVAGYGITDAVLSSDVVTVATANKILKLDASSLLPTGVTGNAGTATKLQTARTISTTGDATGSASFDGSANASIALTLKNTGSAGTYTKVTTDAQGRVTAGAALVAGDIPDVSATYLPKSGGTMAGTLTLAADPVNPLDAATKQYVDATALGLEVKSSVKVATTVNLAALSGLLTIDGITLVAGDRVLVKDQTTTTQNGIYIAAAGAWSRSLDFDGTPSNEVSGGCFTFVEQGSVQADTGWVVSSDGILTVGTSAITWTQFSSAGIINVDTTLTKSGNTIGLKSIVTGATATKVTFDNYGRVTGSSALLAADIPVLDWTKITSGKPTTLVGYGITDAAPLASPALTGTPTAPTAAVGDSSTTLATTAFVKAQNYITSAGAPVQSVNGKTGVVSLILDDISNVSTATRTAGQYLKYDGTNWVNINIPVADVVGAAPLASPALTGTPTAPTATVGTNTTQLATTAFVLASNVASATKLQTGRTISVTGDATGTSVAFDGTANLSFAVALKATGTAGTYRSVTTDAQGRVTAGTNPTTIAGYGLTDAAPLASPALTGVPTAPTAAVNTNTTQLATTAFVVSQISTGIAAQAPRKYTATIGDGVATSFTKAHGLANADLAVTVRNASTGEIVFCDMTVDATNIILTFAAAPAANAYKIVAIG